VRLPTAIAIIGNLRDGAGFEAENLAAEIRNLLNPAWKISPLIVVTKQHLSQSK